MTKSLLLDTSFLITLVSRKRTHHLAAVRYFRHAVKNQMPMYFSSIAASEFAIKQPITDLPLKDFRIINFNVTHAQEAARLWNALGNRDEGDVRHVVRDDMKLIAQASKEQFEFILTDDGSTLFKQCERLRSAMAIHVRAIKLEDGFSLEAFSDTPQLQLIEFPDRG